MSLHFVSCNVHKLLSSDKLNVNYYLIAVKLWHHIQF
uniref:Uncharacterized protein n=1 Tax=Anguilla anguilla TaxID=7936 RepID=A0A0E9RFT7_ANGAN